MLWTSDAHIVRTTDISNITVPGLHPGDTEGRMKWAGNKYAQGMKGMVLDGRVPGYGTQPSLSRGGSRSYEPYTIHEPHALPLAVVGHHELW